jgi:hypothetical protein
MKWRRNLADARCNVSLEDGGEVATEGGERGREAEEDAGGEGEREREGEDGGVEADF